MRGAVRRRRGVAVVAVIVLLLVVGLIIIGMVGGGAHDQDLSARRLETVRAFYAAEGGVNMALRELAMGIDEDLDGYAGTISNDGIPGNDPALGSARVMVSASVLSGVFTLRSEGRAGAVLRVAESDLHDRDD